MDGVLPVIRKFVLSEPQSIYLSLGLNQEIT